MSPDEWRAAVLSTVEIDRLRDQVRGYEEIKLRSVETHQARKAAILEQFAASSEMGVHSGQAVQ